MNLSYTYVHNSTLDELIRRIEIAKGVAEALPIRPHVEENLRRKSLLKSSLFSARIEGNRLRLEDLSIRTIEKNAREKAKIEVTNILHALQWIYSSPTPKKLSLKTLSKLHTLVTNNLSADAGRMRREPSAIFNAAGVAIYMPPPPSEIPHLVKSFISYANRSSVSPAINAALSHFLFEKIHPFLDGNGRVGRLVSTFILVRGGYDFRGLLSFEELLEQQRDEYYKLLMLPGPDITLFVEFFLQILVNQAEKIIDTLKTSKQETVEDTLLPRRQEILSIIRDHQLVSFDFIKRRFLRISPSTLHFDLKQLLNAKLIKKLGSTRGALYKANE